MSRPRREREHCVPVTDESGTVIASARVSGPLSPAASDALRALIRAATDLHRSRHPEHFTDEQP